jgi:polysaccharide biosynthesis/export protein
MGSNKGGRGVFAALLACLLAAACAGSIAAAPEPEQMLASEYRLGAGDQLRVTVFGEDGLTGEYVVSSQGVISFPLVGDVPAMGKTAGEFTDDLGARLRQGYLRDPNIAVEVLNYRPFYILGEVNQPGTYPYSASLTVINAVATAKGFTYRADEHHVYIKHADEGAEHEYRLTTSTPVLPGDTIRVGERHF